MVVLENPVEEIGNFFAPHVIDDVLREDEREIIKPKFIHDIELYSSMSRVTVEGNENLINSVSGAIFRFAEDIVDSYDFRITASFGYFTYQDDGTAVDYTCCHFLNYHVLSERDYDEIFEDLDIIKSNCQNNIYKPHLQSDKIGHKIGKLTLLLQILEC